MRVNRKDRFVDDIPEARNPHRCSQDPRARAADQGSEDSHLLSVSLPGLNESPLSFEDIAVEIDMARNNIDALIDEDHSDADSQVSPEDSSRERQCSPYQRKLTLSHWSDERRTRIPQRRSNRRFRSTVHKGKTH